MAEVVQIEAEGVVRFCHAAFEHGEHFGRVTAGAEDDEEVRGLLSMAAGGSEGFGTRGIEDGEQAGEEEEGGGDEEEDVDEEWSVHLAG